jgi:hypothetical protein
MFCTFTIITFLNQQVESFKKHHKKLLLKILNFVHNLFYNFNISIFNFNVEVEGQSIISKSLTLRNLFDFF